MESKNKTKVGKFLAKIGKPLDVVLDIAADITGIEALDKIGDSISGSKELTDEDKEIALALVASEKKDIADARDMQKVALKQDDLFSKRFVYYIASFWSLIASAFILAILFVEIPENNIRLIDVTLGFLLGTIIASIITYFFGSSESSSKKNDLIEKLKGQIK